MVLAICTNVEDDGTSLRRSRAVLQKTLASGENLGEVTARRHARHADALLRRCHRAQLVQFLDFWGQFAARRAAAGSTPVRASARVVMSTVTAVSPAASSHAGQRRAPGPRRGGPRRWRVRA